MKGPWTFAAAVPVTAASDCRSSPGHRELFQPIPVGGGQIDFRVALSSVQQDAETQTQGLAAANRHGALFAPCHGVFAKGVGNHQPVITSVKPAGSEVRGIGHDGDAQPPAVDLPPVVAPAGLLAPVLPFVDTA